ncbi:hypothetical protein [Eubacterium callanderi]|uniref:hypothetical protein n=1 Tax=Eubacterium callanderi TaxID=53442 RepID=UPI001D15271C|nr:hypothetical protein [Eubacterium callanderi]
MMRRKIELMHNLFGKKTGFCKDCGHFYLKQYSNVYQKCEVYGDSHGEGTDWKATYPACGLYPDAPYKGRNVVKLENRGKKKKLEKPLEGQLKIEVY